MLLVWWELHKIRFSLGDSYSLTFLCEVFVVYLKKNNNIESIIQRMSITSMSDAVLVVSQIQKKKIRLQH